MANAMNNATSEQPGGSLTARYEASVRIHSFLNKVYLWMGFGLLATALSCYWAVNSVDFMMWVGRHPMGLLALLGAELLLVIVLTAALPKIGTGTARLMFLVYAVLSGLTLGPLVSLYTSESLTLAFLTTACTFGAMSVIGLTTKKDMSTWGRTLTMILVGLVIAMVVNLFVGSSTFDFVISGLGVILFSALTAYDTQRLKNMGLAAQQGENKAAVYGALALYLDFINLFLFLLRFLGKARN